MTIAAPPRRTFWVDVEDLFGYFRVNPHPSGIQRLVFELLSVLPERARSSPGAPRIALVRHTGDDGLLREVAFADVAQLFDSQPRLNPSVVPPRSAAGRAPVTVRSRASPVKRLRLAAIRQVQHLPPQIAEALLRAGVQQMAALRYGKALLAAMTARRPDVPPAVSAPPPPAPAALPEDRFAGRRGDVFLVLGAPWLRDDYGALLGTLRQEHGITPVLLCYDLIPVRRPEWCAADLVRRFAAWLETTLPHCDRLLAISHATAADVGAYAHEIGLSLAGPVTPVPIGTGLGRTAQRAIADAPPPLGLPPPGSYVLFVSTLEARKNHALLFRVWRQLLAELPRERVPTLVFAGRVGWLVADLMQQLENAAWLDGKIRLFRDPTDAELNALYRGCQFTVFPSLFEGWGLPVSESLALGCPCVASNRTSLPEAGGDLARYFDPENFHDAYGVLRATIEDQAGLAAWRERVVREFRPVPWERTADAILAACPPPDAAPSAAALLERAT